MGRYHLLRKLASGGMAELYLACAEGLGGFRKLVVVKRVLPHLAENGEFVRMLLQEARLAAALNHPNVVSVLDVGETDGEYFVVMEYVHGRDVHRLLRDQTREGGLPLRMALAIALGAARGLHHAHQRTDLDGSPLGIVHRDVSPSNVLVGYDGSIKVTDFGIAKASAITRNTRSGSIKGKAGYMAPEQCRGEAMDRRVDVFALGILLYELTTHQRMFWGDNDFAVMNRIVEGRWDPPNTIVDGYPQELEQIITRAVSLEPAARYPDAESFAREVEAFTVAKGLQCTTAALAAWMEQQYGSPPMPQVERQPDAPAGGATVRLVSPEPTSDETPSSETPVGERNRGMAVRVAVLASSLLVTGALGWMLASTRAESPDDAATSSPPESDEPGDAAPARAELPAATLETPPTAVPPAPEPEAAPTATGSAPPAVEPDEPTPKPAKSTRSSRRRSEPSSKRSSKPAKSPSSSLFPVGR